MSNPNEDQWNGQTGQPNQSQPSQPNPAGQPGQPQYGAYDSNHGGQYPPQGAPGAQDTQNQHAQNGQPQGEPNQNPYYGPYAYNPNYGPNGQPAWGPDGRRYQADGQSNCVCSIESGPCERVDVFHVSGRFWSISACGEKRTPARPAWTSFPS